MTKRHFFWVLSFFLLTFFSFSASAASYDPKLHWKTASTEHFHLNYPETVEQSTVHLSAKYFEEAYSLHTKTFNWKPRGKVEVVLIDNTDEANGLTSILPYNWIILYVVAPRAESTLSNYNNWLRLLIFHEFAHTVHLDAVAGMWRPVRFILGQTAAPNGMQPVWIKEGLATYLESTRTGKGRANASLTEMMVRTAVLEQRFPKISEADGFQWEWPSYNLAYLFGVEFVEYLANTYGEEKIVAFTERTRRSPVFFMINRHAKKVFGKTFYQLWKDWEKSLEIKYAEFLNPNTSFTSSFSLHTKEKDEQQEAPSISPDGQLIAYASTSPHHGNEIKILNLKTKKITKFAVQHEATQMAWTPDSSKIIYSALQRHKRYNRFFDLWEYDVKSKKHKRLTSGMRARDPVVSPDGKEILFVRGDERGDNLYVYTLETRKAKLFTKETLNHVQLSRPSWSKKNNLIAVSVHRLEEGWKMYLLNPKTKSFARISKSVADERDASWQENGEKLFYISDAKGIFNLFVYDAKHQSIAQASHLKTGIFSPSSADGKTVYAQVYNADGYELQQLAVEHSTQRPALQKNLSWTDLKSKKTETENEESVVLKEGKYSSFGKSLFLPRFIVPIAFYTGETFIAGGFTGGTDILNRHAWQAGGTYRFDAKHPGYFANYSYNRFRPIFGFGIQDSVVYYGNVFFPNTARVVQYFEERRNSYAYVAFPIKRHSFSTTYFYEDRFPQSNLTAAEASLLTTGKFAGLSFGYNYSSLGKTAAAISAEQGRKVRLSTSVTNHRFGSDASNEQTIFSGDWREFVKTWGHQVLALRAAGGITFGDTINQGTFGMGGALGEGAFGAGGSLFYLPLRGLPISAISSTRAMLGSAEYRFRLASPQRSLGTWPFYLKNVHASLFADYGNGWNSGEKDGANFKEFFGYFLLGVGAELRADFVVGYGLPVVGRLGYGIIVVNRDRLNGVKDDLLNTDVKNGVIILQFGTSF